LVGEHLPVRLERELEATQVGEQQREVQPRTTKLVLQLQRAAERLDRILAVALMRQDDAAVFQASA